MEEVGSMGFQQWGRGWREELQLADARPVCFCILKRKNGRGGKVKNMEFMRGFKGVIHRSSQLPAVGEEKERKGMIIARLWVLGGWQHAWSFPQHTAV